MTLLDSLSTASTLPLSRRIEMLIMKRPFSE
jgi:hypothetical protein